MSINKIEARSEQGDLLTLVLAEISSGYIVEEVEGLDPVKATLASSNFAGLHGQQYHGSTRDIRNIRITLSFAPDYSINQTIRELRTRLYQFFMSGTAVSLRFFMDDGLVVDIDGVAESCEAPLFVQEPMLVCSVVNHDPDFVDNEETVRTGLFTTDEDPAIFDIPDGGVDTGFVIDLEIEEEMNEFTIYHTDPMDRTQTMQFAIPLEVGDLITINTKTGQKAIDLTRASVKTSVMYSVSPQSPWIQFKRGTNQLRVYSEVTPGSPVTVTYRTRYGGL